jgi:O-antigen/teichoic acid export membrane protein
MQQTGRLIAPLLNLLGLPRLPPAAALRTRLRLILPNVVRTVSAPLGGALASFLILRVGSRALLNRYVAVMLVQGLALLLVGWGTRSSLYKALSDDPGGVRRTLGEALAAKALLLVPATAILLLVPGEAAWALPIVWAGMVARAALATFEPLVTFRRAFGFAAAVDLAGTALFAALFALPVVAGGRAAPGLDLALAATAIADGVRICAYLVRFRADRPLRVPLAAARRFLRATFPFFLITLAGAFASRIDVYTLGFFARREELGQYNVLVNLLSGATMILSAIPTTFSVTLLRAPEPTYRRAWRGFLAAGALLAAAGTWAIGLVMHHLYGFPLTPAQLALAFTVEVGELLTLKAFYGITRSASQHLATAAVFAGGLVNLLAGLALIPHHGVTGALLASNAGQWSIFGVALLLVRAHAHLRRHDHV